MPEDVDFARTFKQPRPGTRAALIETCPRCSTVMTPGNWGCFWHSHGCRNGCGAISAHDGSCDMCGAVTFSCPGDGCRSLVHHGEAA